MTLQFRYGAAHDPADCNVTTHDNNGNVYSQTVTRGTFLAAQAYTYDGVDLATEADGAVWSRDYVYDPYGNMKLATSGFTFDAKNQLTDSGYDQAGNMTSFLGGAMTYDANNKMTSFTGTGMPVKSGEYLYDGQGQRVQRMSTEGSTTTTTTYVYDAFGKLAAEYSSRAPTGTGGTFFRTTDHLGSTRLVTDAAQNACEERDFYPFGEEIVSGVGGRSYAESCGFSQQFTAKERDDESGLDYFGARYYGSSLGRFTSADAPFADQLSQDPQSWNLYGYARNQPLRLVDADGRKVVVSGKVALENIRSTVPEGVRENIVLTKSGAIDSDMLNSVTSDDKNVEALRFMVGHSSVVEVRTDSGVEMGEFGFIPFEYTPYTTQDGTSNPTVFGGVTSEMTDTNGRIVVTLSDGTGIAAGMPAEESAATAAHEIYGHAKRQMSGQPWLHDEGGPVDEDIKEIEDRTREMHENQNQR